MQMPADWIRDGPIDGAAAQSVTSISYANWLLQIISAALYYIVLAVPIRCLLACAKLRRVV